jgi:hypothetical protein
MRKILMLVCAALTAAPLAVVGGSTPARAVTAATPELPVVFRADNHAWYFRNSLTTGVADFIVWYGARRDLPVTGDWDGNGSRTIGVFRRGIWYLRNSNTKGPADIVFHYGNPGDIPIAGDWDGNGTFTPGVVRGNTWYLRNTNTSGFADVAFTYGNRGDLPMAGDWDGSGTDTPGVYRPPTSPASDATTCAASNGPCYISSEVTWYLRNSNSNGVANQSFRSGFRHIPADWDGDGTTTLGVMDSRARWAIYTHADNINFDQWFHFGSAGDVPLVWSATNG